jgi:hypothetical protein
LFHLRFIALAALALSGLPLPGISAKAATTLFLTGLPCPGGQGEPTNSHPLVWSSRSGINAEPRSWFDWQQTIRADYGDVFTVTWFGECTRHSADWDCLRVDVVTRDGIGAPVTNSSTVKMKAGSNFLLTYLYWYTNGSSLLPTNFIVVEAPVLLRSNSSLLLSDSAGIHGEVIDPPIWSDLGPITNAFGWPLWGTLPDGFPHWPSWQPNPDGALMIVPSAQLPVCNLTLQTNSMMLVSLQALPGTYNLQSTAGLSGVWTNQAAVEAGPEGTASLDMPIGSSNQMFLRAQASNPLDASIGYTVRFETLGSDFAPVVFCSNALPDQLLWKWSDSTTSTDFPLATKSFGSPGGRTQRLTVVPASAISAINLGFDASDGGETTPLSNRPPQGVSAVYFPYPLTGLQYWCSSYNPIANVLDFTGFYSLEAIECFHCMNLPDVVISNLPSLKRVCFEQCDLQQLILTADPNLEDVRAALNSYTNIILGGGTGPKIWHFCTRDNEQLTQDLQGIMTNFFSLREPWIWHDNQSGALHFVSSNLTDVEFQDNQYSSADFSHQPNLQIVWGFDNALTNFVLTGCDSLQDLELQNNLLTSQSLDAILAALDASTTNLMVANLTQNPGSPTAVGYGHYANLTNRGAIVYLDFLGTNPPAITFDSMSVVNESCSPPNNAIDPGETVTLEVAFKNSGAQDTTDLVITLLETNGVAGPGAPQEYGQVPASGGIASRIFSFTARGNCGERATATFHLQDGVNDLGTVDVPFDLGVITPAFTESFDTVNAPQLPSGWTSSATGVQNPWVTRATSVDSGINAVFCGDPANVGISELVSVALQVPAAAARLTFRNNFDLEPGDAPGTANDGGVLEIKIGPASFADILASGGSFSAGGYTGTITNIWGNPLAGRQCWSGNSGGYITTIVNLPDSASGQTIQLRWRCATDNGNSGSSPAGWRIDTVRLDSVQCCAATPPARH